MKNNQLAGEVGNVDGNRMMTGLEFNYVNKNYFDEDPKRILTLQAEINDQDLLMFSVKEAYASFGSKSTKMYLGRRILPWSTIDQTWGFGKLNNRSNFNGFEPGQEGLTGFFLKKRMGKTTLEGYASYLYIPEMNPSLDINKVERTITSRSPWVRPPSDSIENPSGGGEIPVLYDVDYPDLSDVVFRYSLGLSAKIDIADNFELKGFWTKKPENSISISADVQLLTAAPQKLVATVNPEVYYHDVTGLSANFDLSDYFKLYVGYMGIFPEEFPDTGETPFDFRPFKEEKINEEYVGGGLVYGDHKTSFGIHYVARISKFKLGEDLLSEAPRWNQAINVNVSFLLSRRLRAFVDFKYDMLSLDRLGMLTADYQLNKKFRIGGGIQAVGAPRDEGTYWGQFRNNDSLFTHLRYVF